MKRLAVSVCMAACLVGCGTDLPRDGLADGSGPLDYALRSRFVNVDITRVLTPPESIATMATRPGDPALYLVAQIGRVYRYEPPSIEEVGAGFDVSRDAGEVVLDITTMTLEAGEEGLVGLAFDPTGNAAYVYHSRPGDGFSVLAEYRVGADGVFDEPSRRELFTIEQPSPSHNGGQLLFGPDSMLYIGVGDGSLFSDTDRVALGLTSPLGKILRIDPTPSGGLPYTIPPENPAVDLHPADPRIWARGLRNPTSFSFDPATGDLWIADVGQAQWEEINHAPAFEGRNAGRGVNFGWSAFEGPERFNDDQPVDDHTPPRLAYEHPNAECGAVQDGLVVRNAVISELDGWYVYGDWCQGQVLAHDLSDPQSESLHLGDVVHFTQMVQTDDGNLYASATQTSAAVPGGVFIVTRER